MTTVPDELVEKMLEAIGDARTKGLVTNAVLVRATFERKALVKAAEDAARIAAEYYEPMIAELVGALREIANDPYTNSFARTIALNTLAKHVGRDGE